MLLKTSELVDLVPPDPSRKKKREGRSTGGWEVDRGGVVQLCEAGAKVTKQAGSARCLEQVMPAVGRS